MIEVLKQMVEALEWCHGGEPIGTADAIQAGKKLIAELQSQEPVAWHEPNAYGNVTVHKDWALANGWQPLYAHPPQRTWVGLTDEEIAHCLNMTLEKTCRAIEAKLKEKNT
jgi:hypothetical protein